MNGLHDRLEVEVGLRVQSLGENVRYGITRGSLIWCHRESSCHASKRGIPCCGNHLLGSLGTWTAHGHPRQPLYVIP